MIKAIIARHIKKDEDISHFLRQLRGAAIREAGYVSGQTLVNTEDDSEIVVISTWLSLEHWKAWETSEERLSLYRLIKPLLREEPRVKTYRVAATEGI